MKSTDIVLKRLRSEYEQLGSYEKLADKYAVNVRYVWNFIKNGVVPPRDTWKQIRCAPWVSEATDNLAELRKQKEAENNEPAT
jgi:hypothetical protein